MELHPPSTPPARLGLRLGARVVDIAVVGWLGTLVVIELLGRIFGGDPLGRIPAPGRLAQMSDTRVWVGMVLVVLAYEVVPLAWRGTTFGKAALGLAVVRIDSWEPPGGLRALLRTAVLYLPLTVPVVGPVLVVIVVAPVFFWPTRRGLHDVVAGTAVIRPDRS